MLKTLRCLTGLLGVATASLAQSPLLAEPRLSPDDQDHAVRSTTPGSRQVSSTVRLPTRTSAYNWVRSSGQWSPQALVTTSVYNTQGQLVSVVTTDSVTQRPQVRKTYNRNPAGITALYQEEEWTGTAWQNRTQWINTLTAQNQLVEQIQQQWTAGAWSNTYRIVQTFDSHNSRTSFRRYEWINGSWALLDAAQYDHVYNAQGLVYQLTNLLLNSGSGQLEPIFRVTYTYLGNTGLEESTTVERMSYGSWTNENKYDGYVYDALRRVVRRTTNSWVNGAWQPTFRYTTTFDTATNSATEIGEELDGTVWSNSTRQTTNYDVFGTSLGYTSERWRNNAWSLIASDVNVPRYNAANDKVVLLARTTSGTPPTLNNVSKTYYSNFQSYILATRPAAKVAASWQPYPNPSTSRVTLAPAAGQAARLRTAEVVNGLGQVVRQQRFGQAAGAPLTLELGELPAGLYTLRLQTDNGTELHRLQKE